jgi:hypothetical protein
MAGDATPNAYGALRSAGPSSVRPGRPPAYLVAYLFQSALRTPRARRTDTVCAAAVCAAAVCVCARAGGAA